MINNKDESEIYKQKWRYMNYLDIRLSRLPAWIMSKEIGIFNYSNVPDYCVEPVKQGLFELIHELNMDFKVKNSYVDNSVETAVNNLRCGGNLFESISYSADEVYMNKNRTSNFHASVIIIDQKAPYNNYDWGFGAFGSGIIYMYLPKERQSARDFIKKIAKHEAVHLLGLGEHHGDAINGSKKLAKAYNVTHSCVFNYYPDTLKLCNMCEDALIYNWKKIEEQIGIKFLKK
ncbi:MAG: hypothetical protein U9R34_04135 [Nanoarchaeota archaeon]|nr:hypothetical protein [Nanoarchaeota archaeon]